MQPRTSPIRVGSIVKSKRTGDLYSVHQLAYSTTLAVAYYLAYRLSSYDGMPVGPLVHLTPSEVE